MSDPPPAVAAAIAAAKRKAAEIAEKLAGGGGGGGGGDGGGGGGGGGDDDPAAKRARASGPRTEKLLVPEDVLGVDWEGARPRARPPARRSPLCARAPEGVCGAAPHVIAPARPR